jgi:copper chaperone CopZ
MKKTLHIDGMYCSHCAGLINIQMYQIDGVKDVNVSIGDKTAIITSDREIDEHVLNIAVQKAGYTLISID